MKRGVIATLPTSKTPGSSVVEPLPAKVSVGQMYVEKGRRRERKQQSVRRNLLAARTFVTNTSAVLERWDGQEDLINCLDRWSPPSLPRVG